MKIAETLAAGIITVAVVYWIFNPQAAQSIQAISQGGAGFVNALLGRG